MTYELIVTNFILFVLGFTLGRITSNRHTKETNVLHKPNSFLAGTKPTDVKKLEINESKFVNKVKTDSFEKSYKELGENKKTKDNISSSVSKLSQLKNKK